MGTEDFNYTSHQLYFMSDIHRERQQRELAEAIAKEKAENEEFQRYLQQDERKQVS